MLQATAALGGANPGQQTDLVSENAGPNNFPLVRNGNAAALFLDSNDYTGVLRAAGDLQADIERVTGSKPALATNLSPAGVAVIVGTLGKSSLVDNLVKAGKFNADAISGKWESFIIATVTNPLPGVDQALVIAGSDKRGTIYGIYEISGQIGVSPWYYWADVPPRHHTQLFIRAGTYVQGPPSVKYRGIFLNDEAPDLTLWVREKYGPGTYTKANYGAGFYTNLFEVILRLKGNYLWPAMWGEAFNDDDTNNPVLADEYGIVMGTSHQEPMGRNQAEWDRNYQSTYGSWNYARIPNVVSNFWREGIERNKNYENLITIGLRGANDTPMAPGGPEANKALLEKIVVDQRKILADVINPDVTKVPQVWCLYKEVMDYYNAGMRVPDDVTLLWAEDNWGNVRRLPTAEERKRSGGAGVYYHFDYHGAPRNYQWLNTDPDSENLGPDVAGQTIRRGPDLDRQRRPFQGLRTAAGIFHESRVGHADRWTNEHLDEFTRLWAEQQFGPEHADEIAGILTAYTQFNGRRKPELLDANTYSLVNYREFENVVADYEALAVRAEKISGELPTESRDAFYELVLFPVKACAQLNAMYLAAAKNRLYAEQGRASANDFAVQTRELFAAQTNLMAYFNRTFAGGKWDHFMDQPYIGYVSWNEPRQNNLNAVRLREIQVPDAAAMGVAVEGSQTAVTNGQISLPQFDSFNRQARYVDVFNKGKTDFDFTVQASYPWIRFEIHGLLGTQLESGDSNEYLHVNGKGDARVLVKVNWDKAPKGLSSGTIKISGPGGGVTVNINAFNPTGVTRDSLIGFVEGDGCVSIEAEHFAKNVDAGANRWIKIPDYGHTLSAMRADGPVDVQAAPGKDSPCLEYKMYLFSTGKVEVDSLVGPTLNFIPGRPLRYAVSFDDEAPQLVTIVPANFNAQNGNRDWEESVRDNGRLVKSEHTISTPGYHTLKIWMVDPAVAVEKIVVNTGGVRPSYLGPPESFHRGETPPVSAR